MRVVIAGPDRGIVAALSEQHVEIERIEGIVTGQALDDAGIADADLFVLTDVSEATSIPIAKDVNPDLRVIVYAPDSIPEFVSAQVDLAIAPGVLDVETVAEELVAAH